MDNQPGTVRRFKASLSGTNLELTGDYNQRLVYQAIRTKGPITRGGVIDLTGLAKPTIAGIVRRLLASGLVLETSRIYGARGQPAAHLEVDPAGCYAIGLHLTGDAMQLVLIDACGNAGNRISVKLSAPSGRRIDTLLRKAIPKLVGQIRVERIIGVGIVASGLTLDFMARPDGTHFPALSDLLPGVPVYIDSDLAASAAGEALFGLGADRQSFYYILIDERPVGGFVMHQSLFKGAHPAHSRLLFPNADLHWVRHGIAAGVLPRTTHPGGSESDEAWLAEACNDLVPLMISINCLLDPGVVLLGGPIPAERLARLAERCNSVLRDRARQIPSHAGIQPARLAADATLIGAASLPMRARLFPTEEALLKGGDDAA